MIILKEKEVEDLICDTLKEIGFIEYTKPFNLNDLTKVIDYDLLKESLIKINSKLDISYIDEAISLIKKNDINFDREASIKALDWLKNGIEIKIEKISNRSIPIFLVDYCNKENNYFKFIRQMEFSSKTSIRKPDIIIYLNGLPISIIEVKAFEAKERLEDAYKQIKYYANNNNDLKYWNVFSCVSNGVQTRYGSIYSFFNHWYTWKLDSNNNIEQDALIEQEPERATYNYYKNIVGIYNKSVFLNLLKNYIFYGKKKNEYTTYIPNYYQYGAVEKTLIELEKSKNNKGGVIWHTQGSGKSVTMLFLASRIKTKFKDQNYKLILVTDRIELDDQLYDKFVEAKDYYLYTEPKKIESRKELKRVLSDDLDFGIYMTTIQKFTELNEPLSKKENIIVIADEAHRSQNNIETDYFVDRKNEIVEPKEGYAKYMRSSFPNAKFIGFTGTPLMGTKKTIDIFGNYIDKYTMSQSVLDGSTVPIFYEKRKIEILIDKLKSTELDDILNQEKEIDDSDYINNVKYEHIKKKLINISNILSGEEVIQKVVEDFWIHYNNRKRALNGKALFVAFNRKIAHLIFKEMINQKPEFKDKIRLVITSSNKDDEELLKLIPNKEEKTKIATEFKKDNSKIKIVIVVDMWLTGFDVPDLDTLYLFKVIRWHNLMQTIARVNRTYENKNDGLVVDYIGIWKHISEALKQYADKTEDAYDIDKVKTKLLDLCLNIRKKYFDYNNIKLVDEWIVSESIKDQGWNILQSGVNLIENLDKDLKDEFFGIVSKVSKLYKLCSTSLDPKQKKETQFYILIKNFIRSLKVEDAIDVEKTIERLKSKMNDIIKTGDIEISNILLDGKRDLTYVFNLLEKELKLIKNNNASIDNIKILSLENQVKDQIHFFSKRNPLKGQKLSEDLKKLIDKYSYDKNIEEYIEGLIKFSKIMIESNNQNNDLGIEDERILAFYNVIADDKFKLQNHNSEILKEITLKIIKVIKDNYTPQWYNNKKLQDKINSNIKILLKKDYNYPPQHLDKIPKILIDEINKVVKLNPEYFVNKEDM